jgi:hypothetical protein
VASRERNRESADLLPGSQVATIVVSLKNDAGEPMMSDTLTVWDSGVGALDTGGFSTITVHEWDSSS